MAARLLKSLSASVSSSPCLRVDTLQTLFFVEPAPSTERPAELEWLRDDDTLRHGTVTLILPVRRRVTSLRVQILGTAVTAVPGYPTETWTTHEQTMEMDVDEELEGQHEFAFSFKFPSTTAPFERTLYGGVTHKIVATAPGLGRLGGNLTAEAPIEVVALDRSGEGPKPFEMSYQSFHESLGPDSLSLSSPFLTVGGTLDFELQLHCPIQPVQIRMCVGLDSRDLTSRRIEAQLIEGHSVTRHSGETIGPLSFARTILVLDSCSELGRPIRPGSLAPTTVSAAPGGSACGVTLRDVVTGEPFVVKESIRLLNDECARVSGRKLTIPDLRASTPEGTITPFRVSHHFRLRVCYSLDGQPKVLSIQKPITIYSCCCHLASLLLPQYSKSDPLKSIDALCARVLNGTNCPMACICGMAIEQLRDEQGKLLYRADHSPVSDPILSPMPKAM